MTALVLGLVQQLLPVFLDAYNRHTKAHPGEPVTVEGLTATLKANGDAILAEGAAWRAAHPNA